MFSHWNLEPSHFPSPSSQLFLTCRNSGWGNPARIKGLKCEESPKALASVLWLCVLEKAGGSGPQEKSALQNPSVPSRLICLWYSLTKKKINKSPRLPLIAKPLNTLKISLTLWITFQKCIYWVKLGEHYTIHLSIPGSVDCKQSWRLQSGPRKESG